MSDTICQYCAMTTGGQHAADCPNSGHLPWPSRGGNPNPADNAIETSIARLEIKLSYVSEAVTRIEMKLDAQNGRLRTVEQEQARQGVYTGIISAFVGGIVGGVAAFFQRQ